MHKKFYACLFAVCLAAALVLPGQAVADSRSLSSAVRASTQADASAGQDEVAPPLPEALQTEPAESSSEPESAEAKPAETENTKAEPANEAKVQDLAAQVKAVAGEANAAPAEEKSPATGEKSEFEAVMSSGRDNLLLGDIEPLRDLISGAGLVCDKLDGGFINVDKKTRGKRIIHYECGRLWCDDQASSYRIYYHGEYEPEAEKPFVNTTLVEPWSKKPPMCKAE